MRDHSAHLRPARERQALIGAAVFVVLVILSTQLLGACDPDDPRLTEPTGAQRASSTSSLPSTDSVPTSPSTAPSVPSTGQEGAVGETVVASAKAGVTAIGVYKAPNSTEPPVVLANPGEYGNPQVFVVVEEQPGWLRVRLPVQPNGSEGWIRDTDVDLAVHDYRIDVSLSGFKLWVRKGAETILEAPIGVGTSDTPTPASTYYTWVLLDPTNKSTYGQYAYGLSGFSEVLREFAGGEPRLGIHGTADEESIGRNVSHGCIRVSDDTIITMVEQIGLPLGVPVSVTA